MAFPLAAAHAYAVLRCTVVDCLAVAGALTVGRRSCNACAVFDRTGSFELATQRFAAVFAAHGSTDTVNDTTFPVFGACLRVLAGFFVGYAAPTRGRALCLSFTDRGLRTVGIGASDAAPLLHAAVTQPPARALRFGGILEGPAAVAFGNGNASAALHHAQPIAGAALGAFCVHGLARILAAALIGTAGAGLFAICRFLTVGIASGDALAALCAALAMKLAGLGSLAVRARGDRAGPPLVDAALAQLLTIGFALAAVRILAAADQ